MLFISGGVGFLLGRCVSLCGRRVRGRLLGTLFVLVLGFLLIRGWVRGGLGVGGCGWGTGCAFCYLDFVNNLL